VSSDPPPDPVDQSVVDHLEKYAPDHACPLCRSSDWDVSTCGFMPMSRVRIVGNTMKPRPPAGSLPLAAVCCTNCGYTYFINLMFARVVPT